MKVAIAGFDTEGKSSYDYFKAQGHDITVLDQKEDLAVPEGAASVLGSHYLENLDRFDLVVRTAGLPPTIIADTNPHVPQGKITSQINEFFQSSPTRNIIGVTGTKGKGTTSTLIYEMLKGAGKDTYLAGNIGLPALDLIPKLTTDSWVVLELSSFQLSDLRFSPMIAVCLMVVPEHLNWHKDMSDYMTAKQQLFVWQTFDDIAIYNADNENSTTIAEAGNGVKVPYYAPPGALVDVDAEGNKIISIGGQLICRTYELKLLGEHNWQNVCAAVTAVWQVTHHIQAIRKVLTTFSGLPHRLELVREFNGVRYYDDSFGTTPETATVAIQAFKEPKIVILGGSDKGASYAELAQTIAGSNVRRVLIIGEQGPKIQAALDAAGFTDYIPGGKTISEIVHVARDGAQSGDVVLLSTGCASFDMFHDYKDRGDQFKAAVNAL